MNSWAGLGDVIVGMQAQGFDVELKQFPDAWRATFYASFLMGSACGTATTSTHALTH